MLPLHRWAMVARPEIELLDRHGTPTHYKTQLVARSRVPLKAILSVLMFSRCAYVPNHASSSWGGPPYLLLKLQHTVTGSPAGVTSGVQVDVKVFSNFSSGRSNRRPLSAQSPSPVDALRGGFPEREKWDFKAVATFDMTYHNAMADEWALIHPSNDHACE